MTCHSVNNNIRTGLVISLCSSSNHLISYYPQTVSNFRHLLSCGTIVGYILSFNDWKLLISDIIFGRLYMILGNLIQQFYFMLTE